MTDGATFCCKVCPHAPTCQDIMEAAFARPEEITMDFTSFFDGPEDPSLVPQRPTCPRHFIELPVTGVCEECE